MSPYELTERIAIGDSGLTLIVSHCGSMFRLENNGGAIEFPSDASEALAMALRRAALASPPSRTPIGGLHKRGAPKQTFVYVRGAR